MVRPTSIHILFHGWEGMWVVLWYLKGKFCRSPKEHRWSELQRIMDFGASTSSVDLQRSIPTNNLLSQKIDT